MLSHMKTRASLRYFVSDCSCDIREIKKCLNITNDCLKKYAFLKLLLGNETKKIGLWTSDSLDQMCAQCVLHWDIMPCFDLLASLLLHNHHKVCFSVCSSYRPSTPLYLIKYLRLLLLLLFFIYLKNYKR